MKEAITKFDLESAFKALDEIEVPVAEGVKANKPALTEIFSRKTKFDALMEEYYDVSDMTELDDAKEAREAEVAQAKLARIEKIVDLDAESPEDLLPSYVGKFIMQCPQCMTLFYKDPEDVEASEEDPNTVNVNEACQHCGNEAGYTLIGKVGEATQDEMAEYTEEETVDVTSTDEEAVDEIPEEPSDEDLDIELDELDLDLEEPEEEEIKAEESFNASGEQVLVEQLTEEAELEVSADEFETLIQSPEFKKPVSDTEARAMMNELDDESKEEVKEQYYDDSINGSDDMMHYGQFLYASWVKEAPDIKQLAKNTYRVTRKDGRASVVVKIDESTTNLQINFTVNNKPFSAKSIKAAQEIILKELESVFIKQFDVDLDESVKLTINNETLRYAVINPDGTYAGVPCTSEEEARELAAQKEGRVIVELSALKEGIFDKIKDKFADTIDNVASKLKSREAKADWVLANALEDYNNVKADTKGQLVPDENNQRFQAFVVVGYTDKYSNGKVITMAPSFNNKDLVVGKNGIQEKDSYEAADNIAKGWSMAQGNGPAFIYLAKSKNDPTAVFLCEYFKGELKNDQLEKYFNVVKDHLKGAKLMAKGGMNNTEEEEAEPVEESIEATQEAEHVECCESYLTENLDHIMNDVEDLQEASLEKLISESLVESYGNVAGFRLTECAYTNNKLTVDGTIYFTSGNTRKTTYAFSEALTSKDGKISMRGLNEKLGLDKQFILTGHSDSNKTFITESFSHK